MQSLIDVIENFRRKIPNWFALNMNETTTRTSIVNPLLKALGWDVADPEEVQLEFVTYDKKFVDYALMIDRKPVLLVEAKKLRDPLTDPKVITQTVSYANNEGLSWCILTNGAKWCIYRSTAKCAAPDKLVYEVDITDTQVTATGVAERLCLFSRDGMLKGLLNTEMELIQFDPKVRTALLTILQRPKKNLLKQIAVQMGEDFISHERIKSSLERLTAQMLRSTQPPCAEIPKPEACQPTQEIIPEPETIASEEPNEYSEALSLAGKSQTAVSIYNALKSFCLSLSPDIEERHKKLYVGYMVNGHYICTLCLRKRSCNLFMYLTEKNDMLKAIPFSRDVAKIGHWGVGDIECHLTSPQDLEQIKEYIRERFNELQ